MVTVPAAGHLLNWEGANELVEVVEAFETTAADSDR